MDQIQQREKAIEQLRKIKALAERGVGGEKDGAKRKYEELKAKFNITEEEIESRQPEKQRRQQLSFTMVVLQQQLHEEHACCYECPYTRTEEDCGECSTHRNIKDLEEQWEKMAEELGGR